MGESADGDKEALGPGISTLLGAVKVQFLVALLTGLVLSIGYSTQVATAHAKVAAMHEGWIWPIQGLHYWVTAVLIVESLFLVAALLWTGRYTRPYRATLAASVLLASSALLFQVTGNLLPYDRHGVETAVIELGIAARMPGLGAMAQRMLLQGNEFSQDTLRFWYLLHWGVLLLLAVAFFLEHRGRKAVAPAATNGRTVAGVCLIPFVLAIAVRAPLGTGAGPADASAFSDKPSWYTWPLHGSLVMFDHLIQGGGWIGAIAIPGLIVLTVLTLPWWGSKIPIISVRGGTVLVAGLYLGAGLFYGGSFAPLTGTRDPAPLPVASKVGGSPIDKVLAAKGAAQFQSSGCTGCHGANGDGGGGGPSLKTIGTVYPEADFYMRYVHNPTAVNPHSVMPAFPNLIQDQLRALAEFLRGKGAKS